MSILCPCCKARNETSPCRRCKADLDLLLKVDSQRQGCLARAWHAVREQRIAEAHKHLLQAEFLLPDQETRSLRAVLSLLLKDYAQALTHWTHGRQAS
jgi:methylphosphotriester-DNA--protein-cysteine methyltransferase